ERPLRDAGGDHLAVEAARLGEPEIGREGRRHARARDERERGTEAERALEAARQREPGHAAQRPGDRQPPRGGTAEIRREELGRPRAEPGDLAALAEA